MVFLMRRKSGEINSTTTPGGVVQDHRQLEIGSFPDTVISDWLYIFEL
jgi:hypothetical protein